MDNVLNISKQAELENAAKAFTEIAAEFDHILIVDLSKANSEALFAGKCSLDKALMLLANGIAQRIYKDVKDGLLDKDSVPALLKALTDDIKKLTMDELDNL